MHTTMYSLFLWYPTVNNRSLYHLILLQRNSGIRPFPATYNQTKYHTSIHSINHYSVPSFIVSSAIHGRRINGRNQPMTTRISIAAWTTMRSSLATYTLTVPQYCWSYLCAIEESLPHFFLTSLPQNKCLPTLITTETDNFIRHSRLLWPLLLLVDGHCEESTGERWLTFTSHLVKRSYYYAGHGQPNNL